VGGEVVYSTCTLVPEEDEAVIDSILQRFGQAVEVLTTGLSAPGITTNGSRKYNHEVQKSLRLWPSRFHTAGFFACLLQKRQPLDLPSQPAPSRPFERTGFFQMREKETQRIHAALYAGFQFNLKSVLEKYDLELVGYKQKRYAFPRRLMSDFISLPVQSAGLLIGEESEEGFIPSHEWVSRFFDLFPANRVELSEDQMIHWLNGEDYYGHVDSSPAGTVCLIVDPSGRFLGRGKISGSRIRNMLPHRLV
jgi:16S rRNA (cytosine1407-C5)-methyltransferase